MAGFVALFRGAQWLLLAGVVFVTPVALSDGPARIPLANDRYVRSGSPRYEDGSIGFPFGMVLSAVADVPTSGTVFISPGTYPEPLIVRKPMVLQSAGGLVTIGAGATWHLIDFPTPGGHDVADDDGDGIVDACEQFLAEKYAPVIYHSSDESNLPANVDWFLQFTSLWFYDDSCDWPGDLHAFCMMSPTQPDLLGWWYANGCDNTYTDYSAGTRSYGKHRTFYLSDLADAYHIGCTDSRSWITYYHAYPNTEGGVTIQYWRFYAYNDAANNHGGDWEGIHVVLDSNFQPLKVGFLGHTSIDYYLVSQMVWEGTHPRIFSEGGGHASHPTPYDDYGSRIEAVGCDGLPVGIDLDNPCTFIRQETWTGGQVQWCNNSHVGFCNGQVTPGGKLLNVGAKMAPMSSQVFIRYSGIWGSPGTFYFTSGYWDPAFNETGMAYDGYLTAWGAGITNVDVPRECYPSGWAP